MVGRVCWAPRCRQGCPTSLRRGVTGPHVAPRAQPCATLPVWCWRRRGPRGRGAVAGPWVPPGQEGSGEPGAVPAELSPSSMPLRCPDAPRGSGCGRGWDAAHGPRRAGTAPSPAPAPWHWWPPAWTLPAHGGRRWPPSDGFWGAVPSLGGLGGPGSAAEAPPGPRQHAVRGEGRVCAAGSLIGSAPAPGLGLPSRCGRGVGTSPPTTSGAALRVPGLWEAGGMAWGLQPPPPCQAVPVAPPELPIPTAPPRPHTPPVSTAPLSPRPAWSSPCPRPRVSPRPGCASSCPALSRGSACGPP